MLTRSLTHTLTKAEQERAHAGTPTPTGPTNRQMHPKHRHACTAAPLTPRTETAPRSHTPRPQTTQTDKPEPHTLRQEGLARHPVQHPGTERGGGLCKTAQPERNLLEPPPRGPAPSLCSLRSLVSGCRTPVAVSFFLESPLGSPTRPPPRARPALPSHPLPGCISSLPHA